MSFSVLNRFIRYHFIEVTVRYVFDNVTLKLWIRFELYIYQKVERFEIKGGNPRDYL